MTSTVPWFGVLLRYPRLPSLCRREHESELEEAPRPDGKDHDAQDLVGVDLLVLEVRE